MLCRSGVPILDLLMEIGLVPSKAEGKRLVQQNGLVVHDVIVSDFAQVITHSEFIEDALMIRKGKKVFHRIQLKD